MVHGWKRPWMWSVWLLAVVVSLLPVLVSALPDAWRCVGFLSVCCFVGVAVVPLVPMVEESRERVHMILAMSGGVLTQVCVWVISPLWLLSWFVLEVFMSLLVLCNESRWSQWCAERLRGNGVLVLELVATATLYAALC